MVSKDCAAKISLAVSMIFVFTAETASFEEIPVPFPSIAGPQLRLLDAELWGYLRLGLTYLESPAPLDPPESMPPTYIHPDGRGFGAYGLSPEAYADVQRIYPFFKDQSWEDVLDSQRLYELANMAFADWLLGNLKEYIPPAATQEQIFDVLHRAWNVGLTGYKNGREVVCSRVRRAEEFKSGRSLQLAQLEEHLVLF